MSLSLLVIAQQGKYPLSLDRAGQGRLFRVLEKPRRAVSLHPKLEGKSIQRFTFRTS